MYPKLLYISTVSLTPVQRSDGGGPVADLFHLDASFCEGGARRQVYYVHVSPSLRRVLEKSPVRATHIVSLPRSWLIQKLLPLRPEALLNAVVAADGSVVEETPSSVVAARRRLSTIGAAVTAVGLAAAIVGFTWLGVASSVLGTHLLAARSRLPGAPRLGGHVDVPRGRDRKM